jgi:hypothetical protein
MGLVRDRRRGGTYSVRYGGIDYHLKSYEVPMPGTPQVVIDQAKRCGVVVLLQGDPPPPPPEKVAFGKADGDRGGLDIGVSTGARRLKDRLRDERAEADAEMEKRAEKAEKKPKTINAKTEAKPPMNDAAVANAACEQAKVEESQTSPAEIGKGAKRARKERVK